MQPQFFTDGRPAHTPMYSLGSEDHEVSRLDACFLACLTACDVLQIGFVGIGFALGNAPRFVAVVVTGRVDEQHLQSRRTRAIQQRSGRLFHGRSVIV